LPCSLHPGLNSVAGFVGSLRDFNWLNLNVTKRDIGGISRLSCYSYQPARSMIDLKYSLVIEATADPNFFGFYSPDLEGFTGVGHSIEDCLYKARWGMEEHVSLLVEQKVSVSETNPNPTVVV